MESQLETLLDMSQTLEGSGFSRSKSDALITSMAIAMETFTITPAMLDERIDKVLDAFKKSNEGIRALRGSMSKAFEKDEGIKGLRGDVKNLRTSMIDGFEKSDEGIKGLRGDVKNLRTSMIDGFEKSDEGIKGLRGDVKNLRTSMSDGFEKSDEGIRGFRADVKDLKATMNSMQRTLNEYHRKFMVNVWLLWLFIAAVPVPALFAFFFLSP